MASAGAPYREAEDDTHVVGESQPARQMTPRAASPLVPERGLSAPRRGLPWRSVRRAGVAVALVAVLSALAVEREVSRSTDAQPQAGVAQAYTPWAAVPARAAIPDAPSRFSLDEADPTAPSRLDPARRDPATGRREDGLSQGSFADHETPYLRLVVVDGPADEAPALFVTMVRRAADGPSLFVSRTGERGRIDSRSGPLETLEAKLTALPDGDGSRTCTGFTTRPPAAIRIEGWLCAPLGQAPEPSAIACALDKLVRNGQASIARGDVAGIVARATPREGTDCGAPPAATAHTGSIGRPAKRNEARVRRNAQARP
ncbi:hypothetical protein ASG40_04685 [Methylobacterium sp. Leaf399]|nr:hypothetical protein ASG40_04685 [Methylobacterium sp. Leaf399]